MFSRMRVDPVFLGSLGSLLLSAAALYFGVPLSDPALIALGEQVSMGALLVSGIVAGVRTLAARQKAPKA